MESCVEDALVGPGRRGCLKIANAGNGQPAWFVLDADYPVPCGAIDSAAGINLFQEGSMT